ncbi:MAG: glycosyltransferase family 2 protein [Gammaproteobacteria bacterium]|nr:glycosyltransferase family 2 protein [Gammaproteobacteria bacterium]
MTGLSVGFVTWHTPKDMLAGFLDSLAEAVETLARRMPMPVSVYAICNDAPQDLRAVDAMIRPYAIRASDVRWNFIQGHGNIGYGAAQNLAVRRTEADFHLMCNPDLVMAPSVLLEAVRFLKAHPGAVLAAPRGFDADGRYARLAKRPPTLLALALRALSVRPSTGLLGRRIAAYVYDDALPAEQPAPIELASGCFMVARTSALKAIGGFDERYFLYFEDFDLCRRLAPHGGIYELPTASITHFGGHTARRGLARTLRFVRSGCRYFNRHGWRMW